VNIVVDKTHELMSHSAAEMIASAIQNKPDLSILVATGNTPIETYRQLAEITRQAGIDTSRIRAIQLDEYLGVGADDPRSLYGWMDRAFIHPLGVAPDRVIRFDATNPDHAWVISSYDRMISDIGGIDLAILGLGPNGHLGFNEPPSLPDSPTRVVELSPESIVSNSAYWDTDQEVPNQALTAGMNSILAARQIVLLVSGAHKTNILRETIKGPATANVPASLLQTVSDKVTIHADDAAWGDHGES
jgi:glucosamine-6-phosphate deaminase